MFIGALSFLVCTVPALASDDPAPASLVETARLEATIRSLPTARAARGNIAHQQGLIQTEELIQKWLKELGYEPTTQNLIWNLKYQEGQERKARAPSVGPRPETTEELASHPWKNIYVELTGKELPREVLYVSCHFDAAPHAPGADDDGTGVAALLEVARVLKDRPMKRTVRLMFFNLEEVNLRGSVEYVRNVRPRDDKVIGMVSLEMLGYFSDEPGSQKSPLGRIEGVFEPPTVGDFIGIATVKAHAEFSQRLDREMRAAAPGLKTFVADRFPVVPPDFLRSDHAPFLLAGLPAVMLTDTANFRNPHYHKPTDTIESLDMKRFTLVVRGVAGAVHAIAEPVGAPASNDKPRAEEPGAR